MIRQIMMILTVGLLIFLPFLGGAAFAETYWVSPTGNATWADCQSGARLDGSACCSLSAANSNAVAGDTINIRGGTYTYGEIAPSNSGTLENKITYKAYTGETPILTGMNGATISINLGEKRYISIKGITVHDVDRHFLLNKGASYNELAYCTFSGKAGIDPPKIWDGGISGGDPCTNNWIHHCTFSVCGGGVTESCNDGGGFQLGVPRYDDHSNYNTIEDCYFEYGGHHNLETFTKYNVIRNNVFHFEGYFAAPNPPCPYSPDSNGLYGNRNVQLYDGYDSEGVYNLFEGNRLGHAGRPPDDDGADNLALTSPKNIVRYNSFFNAAHAGIYFKIGLDSYGSNNRVYNNTLYYNGVNEGSGYTHRYGMVFGAGKTNYTVGNVIKNNLFYANYWGDYAARGGLSSLSYQIIEHNWLNANGDPIFVDPDMSDKSSTALPDLSLQASSRAIDGGTHLTEANGAGTNSTTLIVDDALYFQDGSWGSALAGHQGDWIAIGTTNNIVQISSNDYATNTITLASEKTWSDKAKIWLYMRSDGTRVLYGSAPDYGAYEGSYVFAPKNLRVIEAK
jgi:hypothetical protein